MATAGSYLRDWSAAWLALRRWCSRALAALSRAMHRPSKHPFDRAHGVDTDGLIYADALSTGHEHDHHSAGYYATAPSLFHGAIALWRETLAATSHTLRDYTLFDIGCGKCRVVMLASEHEFREVIGIELNPHLAAVARKNLRKWLHGVPQVRGPHRQVFVCGDEVPILGSGRQARRVQIIEGDALDVPLPDGPVALFFFNSFEREMMEMWLLRLGEIAAHRPWPIDLIYVHPEFDALMRQVSGMQVLACAEILFSNEDAAADVFRVETDESVVYRLESAVTGEADFSS